MGLSYTTIKNLSNGFNNYPRGCIQCQSDYKPGNPGTFEDLHSKFEGIETKNFEGAKLIIRKSLSNHFKVTHAISMNPKSLTVYNNYKSYVNQKVGSLDKSFSSKRYRKNESDDGYQFGVSYVGLKKVNQERYPMFNGSIKPNGNLIANFQHTLGCRLRLKLDTEIKNSKYDKIKTTIEYRTDDCTVTATLVDPSILKSKGVLLLQYLQSITTRVAMGFEIALNNTGRSFAEKQTNLAGAFRYSNGFTTFTSTVGESAVRLCYHVRQSSNLQMGAEFQSNFIRNESKGKILYQVSAPMYDLVFRGFFDSNFIVGGVFEKNLYPIPEATLLLSGLFDYTKSDISVGIGLTIG